MILRAVLVWLALAVCAILNGAFREVVLKRALGERLAHLISTLILSAVILAVGWVSLSWIGVRSFGEAWLVGLLWLLLTLAFEFLAGHYVFGNPWSKILADYNVRNGRIWIFVPIVTLFAPAFALGGMRPEHVTPYLVSNTIAVTILLLSVQKPTFARWLIVLIFAYAAIFNAHLALTRPEEYQDFANLAIIPFYRDIIVGPFRANAREFLLLIAAGQAVIAATTALGGRYRRVGAVGTCVFLAAIMPLGVGSAFPFSVAVSLAAVVVSSGGTGQNNGHET